MQATWYLVLLLMNDTGLTTQVHHGFPSKAACEVVANAVQEGYAYNKDKKAGYLAYGKCVSASGT